MGKFRITRLAVFSITLLSLLSLTLLLPGCTLTNWRPDDNEEPVWSPDGTKIAFVSYRYGDGEIYVMNADGSNLTRLTNYASYDPVWSPDGTKIAFRKYDTRGSSIGKIYVMNADGSNQTRLTKYLCFNAAWSPDGTKIAFDAYMDFDDPYSVFNGTGGIKGIYVMNADGSNQTRLSLVGRDPAWSPDGTKIAFSTYDLITSNINKDTGIYVVDIDGTNLTNLTNGYNPGQSPVWSPDGKKIAFNVGTAIYIMNADGSNLTTLSSGGYDPVWSPDGTKIAFAFKGIFVVNADGSNLTRLTNFLDIYNTPVWSPDGKRIVFRSDDDGTSQIYVASTDGSNQAMLSGKSLLLEIKDRDNILLFGFLACMVLIPLLIMRFLRLSGKGQISELAIGSLALGIIGLVGTLLFVPTADYLIFGHTPLNNTSVIRFGFIIFPIASIIAIIFGLVARSRGVKNNNLSGRSPAVTGLWLGIAGLGLCLIAIIIFHFFFIFGNYLQTLD